MKRFDILSACLWVVRVKRYQRKLAKDMNKLLFLLPLLAVTFGVVYAEPLETVDTEVIMDSDGSAAVKLDWNADDAAEKYEVGCVSCIPNVSEFTSDNGFVLGDVTTLPNSSNILLYVIAYDSTDEIIAAQQIIVDIGQ